MENVLFDRYIQYNYNVFALSLWFTQAQGILQENAEQIWNFAADVFLYGTHVKHFLNATPQHSHSVLSLWNPNYHIIWNDFGHTVAMKHFDLLIAINHKT